MDNLTFKQGMLTGSAAILVFVLLCQFVLWYLALALIIAWMPFCIKYVLNLIEIDYVLALYFAFIAFQSIHMTEHVAQIVQIHILGRAFANSHGLF